MERVLEVHVVQVAVTKPGCVMNQGWGPVHMSTEVEADVVIGLSRFWKSRCSAGDYFLSLGNLRGRDEMMAYDGTVKWGLVTANDQMRYLEYWLGDKRRE